MDDIKKLLGKRVKELRKRSNFTQEQFAELVGIEPRNIIKIENGQTFPRVQTLQKICKVLETNISTLFCFEHLDNIEHLRIKVFERLSSDDELLKLVYKMII